jgi:type 1 glutamine amidotransferase
MRLTLFFAWALVSILSAATALPAAEQREPRDVLVVIGPSTHPPGTHEVAAGGRLMGHCVDHAENVAGIRATVVTGWPNDDALLERTDSVVFIGDTFPPQRLPKTERILKELGRMMDRGCGIVCVHYATGLRNHDVGPGGEHPLLEWMGGYFATGCDHHRSVARIYRAAKIEPAAPDHPVSRGWDAFTLHDEPYINNYFGPDGNEPAANVTPLATSMLPPEDPAPQIVAWCVQRDDGGRGFGIVMPHFYQSWKIEDLRTFILNGVVWSAGLDVPAEGVRTTLPPLKRFDPEAVEPRR